MAKIGYVDKIALKSPSGSEINQWRDNNANEVKTIVNANDTTEVSSSATVIFDKITAGRVYGTFATPITTGLIIDPTGVEEGGFVEIIWSGAINPLITGVSAIDIQITSSGITESGIHSIFIMYSGGKYKVSITAKYQQYDSI